MLRIERSSDDGVVFSLSGRIDTEGVAELQRLLSLEDPGCYVLLNLQDVTMVDRDAMTFLAKWESEGINLKNCPAYIRGWINAERGH
jgi:anti-anti-sigma regulatory factor